jgi:(p)ppGpp synthase/HD superfamily hydrolase
MSFTHEEQGRIVAARDFALKVHNGQWYAGALPYSKHIEGVTELVIESGGGADEVIAGYLHDSWEDQWKKLAEEAKVFHGDKFGSMDEVVAVRRMYESMFGPTATQIVADVSDDPKWDPLNKLVRKTMQADKLRLKGPRSKRVKMADLVYNMRSTAAGYDKPDWPLEKRMDYLEGNQRVAYACRNVSIMLDDLFEDARRSVYKIYFNR